MKIEVFNEEMNSKFRGVRLDGEKIKEHMKGIISRLSISHISGGSSFMDEDTKLLLMMLQIVWNEKEELVEKLRGLEEDYPMQGMNDHNTLAFSGLNED